MANRIGISKNTLKLFAYLNKNFAIATQSIRIYKIIIKTLNLKSLSHIIASILKDLYWGY